VESIAKKDIAHNLTLKDAKLLILKEILIQKIDFEEVTVLIL
jgi:hypothetical protein